jgi:hypothetical protein
MKCIMTARTRQSGWYRQDTPQKAHYLAMILDFGCGSAAARRFVAFPAFSNRVRSLSRIHAEENHG